MKSEAHGNAVVYSCINYHLLISQCKNWSLTYRLLLGIYIVITQNTNTKHKTISLQRMWFKFHYISPWANPDIIVTVPFIFQARRVCTTLHWNVKPTLKQWLKCYYVLNSAIELHALNDCMLYLHHILFTFMSTINNDYQNILSLYQRSPYTACPGWMKWLSRCRLNKLRRILSRL